MSQQIKKVRREIENLGYHFDFAVHALSKLRADRRDVGDVAYRTLRRVETLQEQLHEIAYSLQREQERAGSGEAVEECAYCMRTSAPCAAVPSADDDAAWDALAKDHGKACEWILTRAFRRSASDASDRAMGIG